MAHLIRSVRYPSAIPLLGGEYQHMEYFRAVCAGEFSILFEIPEWENIILHGALTEPALHHAALAIAALASSRYHPSLWQHTTTVIAFSIRHYSMAIQDLQRQLDGSSQSLELAVLASIFFSYIEFLLELDSRVEMHIQAGCAMLENLCTRPDRTLAASSRAGSNFPAANSSTGYDLLARAMHQLNAQITSL